MNDDLQPAKENKSRITGWQRVWEVVSVIWIIINYIRFERSFANSFTEEDFILYGFVPVVLGWGIWWIYRGFKK